MTRTFQEEIRAARITKTQWLVTATIASIAVFTMCTGILDFFYYRKHHTTIDEPLIGHLERHGSGAVVAFMVANLFFACGLQLIYVLAREEKRERSSYEKLFYATVSSASFGSIVTMGGYLAVRKTVLGAIIAGVLQRHAFFYEVVFRCYIVLLLILLATAIYRLKVKSKLLYGISETLIAILSNLALIARVDFSHFPHIAVSAQTVIAMGVFTYLLSSGIGNVVDGLTEIEKSRASRIGHSTVPEVYPQAKSL